MPGEFTVDHGTVTAQRTLLGDQGSIVIFSGSEFKKQPTGIHARLLVQYVVKKDAPPATLAWSVLNIERDEDRVRLGNSARRHLDRLDKLAAELYEAEALKADLDRFCLGAWPALLAAQAPTALAGDNASLMVNFIVKPYVIEGGGTILFAPPGKGKSYLLLICAVSVDAGVSSIFPVRQKRVLIINLERSGVSIARRIGRVNVALGLEGGRPILTLNARGRSLDDILEVAAQAVKEHGIDLICLDSISRAGFGDLTDNRPVNRIVDALNGLAPSWIALGHSPRADDTHIFGGVHFDAGADVVIRLISQMKENTLGIGLEIVKENDVGRFPKQFLALEFYPESGRGLKAVRIAGRTEFPSLAATIATNTEEEIEEYLMQVGEATAGDIGTALKKDRTTIQHVASASHRFQTVKRGKEVLFQVSDHEHYSQ